MNSQNLQIKGTKAIGLLQDWSHMLRLILATFSMEEIEEKLLRSQNQKSDQNTSENQEKEKHDSARYEMIQSKSTTILMQIKSLQGVETIQTSSHTLKIGEIAHFSPLFSKTWSKVGVGDLSQGGGRGMVECLILSTNPWGPIYQKTNN
jgi:hypothetical protein